MANWSEVNTQIQATQQKAQQDAVRVFDQVRRKALADLHEVTGRNVILYCSGWLQKGDLVKVSHRDFSIHDGDKNGFMAVIHKMVKSKGLDLILQTPGGDVAATESLVDYLHAKFQDIRVIVPQIAMSAGTMIACASDRVLMGDHSNLGPIDPQFNGLAAHGIIAEFEQAASEIAKNPARIPLWQPIIAKYHPTLIGDCYLAIDMSQEMVGRWLRERMFKGDSAARSKAKKIVDALTDHGKTGTHARHISKAKALSLGLKVESLEADEKLQDAVLTVHHTCIHTFSGTPAIKIIENHQGIAYIEQMNPALSH